MALLFVYGTLRRGEANHHLLADQRFVGTAWTSRRYRLTMCAGYPALTAVGEGEPTESVPGEVWDVSASCLQILDEFEEVPHLYIRQPVALEGDWPLPVEAYFLAAGQPNSTR